MIENIVKFSTKMYLNEKNATYLCKPDGKAFCQFKVINFVCR